MISKRDIALKYLQHLEAGDLPVLLNLFTSTAQVVSPIYGLKNARDFYSDLAKDTHSSKLILKGLFEEENSNKVAIYFEYTWTLKNRKQVVFDVVDIIEFDILNKITKLNIIYDTSQSRGLVNELK